MTRLTKEILLFNGFVRDEGRKGYTRMLAQDGVYQDWILVSDSEIMDEATVEGLNLALKEFAYYNPGAMSKLKLPENITEKVFEGKFKLIDGELKVVSEMTNVSFKEVQKWSSFIREMLCEEHKKNETV